MQGADWISNQLKATDWRNHPLGAMEDWSESLKVSLNNSLQTPFPATITWGPLMILFFNEAYGEFLEDPQSALARPAAEVWAAKWEKVSPLHESVRATGKSILLKDQLYTIVRDGVSEERYFTFSNSAIWDGNEVGGVLGTIYETTDSIVNSRLARLEQEKLQGIISRVPAAVCILDGPDMVFEMVNQNYQKLFPDRQLLGKPLLQAIPELKGTSAETLLREVYTTGNSSKKAELLVPFARSEGGAVEDVYFDVVYQARLNLANEIDGIIVFAYEVTRFVDARRTARQLAVQVEQQARLFDVTLTSIKDSVYTFNLEGRFTYGNFALLDLLGISLEEIKGKNFYDLSYPEDLANSLLTQIAEVIRSGKGLIDETMFTNPFGKEGYYEYIFTPVFDSEGKVILVAGSTREISDRKTSEEAIKVKNEELIHLNSQLIRVNSDLDNFIYTASHDLKSPISNIEGLVNALKDALSQVKLEDPMIDKLLGMILGSVERFNRTIDDLSDITKLQRLNEEDESSVDIDAMIKEIKLDLTFLLQESNGLIKLSFGSLQHVNFSPKNLRSVFYNLIANSLKYRSEDRVPIINISSSENSDYVIITVEDNGIGMDMTQGPSIFGMFQRLHNHVDGTGIGLYIVKKIMDNAEGMIEVESKVGVGSVFRLFFRKTML